MSRDASRAKIKFPDLDHDGDGTVDPSSELYVCVFKGPDWSGLKKTPIKTTCTNTALDAFGNLWQTYQDGKIIEGGTLTFSVDWAVENGVGGVVYSAFLTKGGLFRYELPPDAGETTGPAMLINGSFEGFTPMGKVLAEGDEARFSADMVLKLSGPITFAAAA